MTLKPASESIPASLTVADEILSWLSDTTVHLTAKEPAAAANGLTGSIHKSESLVALQLKAQGVDRVLLRGHSEYLTIAIAESGQSRGSSGRRPFRSIPGRLSFVLLPNEVLDLWIVSPRMVGIVIQVPCSLLLDECQIHAVQDPDLVTLNDTVPGHESLLLACARQLLDLSCLVDAQARQRMTMPLEASILSLLASLVGNAQSVNSVVEPEPPQAIHVQSALAYFEAHLEEPITLTDVCRAVSVSARTLQTSFQTIMQRTPLQALMELRLSRLRQLLLQRVQLRAACEQVGLQPTGRTSANYKRMFDELPSATRQRAPR